MLKFADDFIVRIDQSHQKVSIYVEKNTNETYHNSKDLLSIDSHSIQIVIDYKHKKRSSNDDRIYKWEGEYEMHGGVDYLMNGNEGITNYQVFEVMSGLEVQANAEKGADEHMSNADGDSSGKIGLDGRKMMLAYIEKTQRPQQIGQSHDDKSQILSTQLLRHLIDQAQHKLQVFIFLLQHCKVIVLHQQTTSIIQHKFISDNHLFKKLFFVISDISTYKYQMGLYTSQQQNNENISDEPVFSVYCGHCNIILSQRGCSVNLASDMNVKAFTTDATPESVIESKEYHKYKTCNCLLTKASCKKCQNNCAFHVIYRCEYCRNLPNNEHSWVFTSAYASKTEAKWSQLQVMPKTKVQFKQLLKIIGINNNTLEILSREEINDYRQLPFLSDQMLKDSGITLGQIAILRQLK